MKLITIEMSTLLRFGIVGNASKQVYLPELIQAIVAEFHFSQAPEISAEKLESLEFVHGKYKDFGISKLGIYNDGLVVRSQTNTRRLVDFVAHFEKWIKKSFGIDLHASQTYGHIFESNLIVHSDKNILKIFDKLAKLEKSLSEKLMATSQFSATFATPGFSLVTTATTSSGFNPAAFRFERKTGTATDLGYYFSTAPLETDQHLELLGELESLV